MYLLSITQKYKARDLTYFATQLNQLHARLKAWASSCYIDIIESGSRAKGTAISLASDVDYLVSLTSNCNANQGGLESIYNSLYSTLKTQYPSARKQNVSVRIELPGTTYIMGNLEVDITPARKQTGNTNDHSLWLSKQRTWKQTNIQRHIRDVSKSGRLNEIILLKIWREKNQLEFPSIYLEYLVINDILLYQPTDLNSLENNFYKILITLADTSSNNPLYKRLSDPANSNNILSDLLTTSEKDNIRRAASLSITKRDWKDIIS